jgi:ribosomal protein S18 acetylase RimI-like enzyme
MKPTLTTRIATENDVHDLARLNLAFNGVRESPEALSLRLSDPRCVEQPLVAVLEGRVVGFAALRIVPCVFYDHPHGELTELYVEEKYRMLGVGKELVRLAERLAKTRGVKELFVLTGRDNLAARKLYNSLGYEDGDIALSKELMEADTQ